MPHDSANMPGPHEVHTPAAAVDCVSRLRLHAVQGTPEPTHVSCLPVQKWYTKMAAKINMYGSRLSSHLATAYKHERRETEEVGLMLHCHTIDSSAESGSDLASSATADAESNT